MKESKLRTLYKNIPLSERQSGVFSEKSIQAYQLELRSNYFASAKRRLFKSIVNFSVSYLLVSVAIIGFCMNHNYPLEQIEWVFKCIFVLWFFGFFCFNLPIICRYPTRQLTAIELQLISEIERDSDRIIFEA